MNKRKKQRNKPIVDLRIIPFTVEYSIEAERVASRLVGRGGIHYLGRQMVIEANTDVDFICGCGIRWNNLRDPGNPSKQLIVRRSFDTGSVDSKLHFTVDLVDVINHKEEAKNVH